MQIKFLSILKSAQSMRTENPKVALIKLEAVLEGIWDDLDDEQKWLLIELPITMIERRYK